MNSTVLVTGGNGMVGHALRPLLPAARFLTRQDCDLEDLPRTRELFSAIRPRVVVHLAGLVGGIRDNVSRPWDFLVRNTLVNTHTLQASLDARAEYLIGVSSTCAYPDTVASYPMRENQIHAGAPAESNLPYGYAKRLLGVALDAAARQFGLASAVLYPCNLYGPHDSFDPRRSHLVAALIQKVHDAKKAGDTVLPLLGTGRPLRQFMYVGDLAKVIAHFVESRVSGHFNVATPENLSVDSIAATVQSALDFPFPRVYSGDLDGQIRKDASSEELMKIMPDLRFTSLSEGIRETYRWYCDRPVCD